MIEVTTHHCRQIDKMMLRRLAKQTSWTSQSRIFFRRIWVLFSLSVLALGVWDYAIVEQQSMSSAVVLVGVTLSVMMFGLMLYHERVDRFGDQQGESLLKDAEEGVFERYVCQPTRVQLVTEIPKEKVGYVIHVDTDQVYLAGDKLESAVDEYHQLQLEAGIEEAFTFAATVIIEVWKHSQAVKNIELTGPQIATPTAKISYEELNLKDNPDFKIIAPLDWNRPSDSSQSKSLSRDEKIR